MAEEKEEDQTKSEEKDKGEEKEKGAPKEESKPGKDKKDDEKIESGKTDQPAHLEEKSHHVKVSKMTLQQVGKAIAAAEKSMGGLHSKFGRALLERKALLERDL
ncbi:MAG: hypothetical protein JW893_05180 [Candidatus Omnitrophica bacterium]|nr:hypothetical protein [Candidatus Omnitrophota bacterium]